MNQINRINFRLAGLGLLAAGALTCVLACATETERPEFSGTTIRSASEKSGHAKSYLPVAVQWERDETIRRDEPATFRVSVQALRPLSDVRVQVQPSEGVSKQSGEFQDDRNYLDAGESIELQFAVLPELAGPMSVGVHLSAEFGDRRKGMARVLAFTPEGYDPDLEKAYDERARRRAGSRGDYARFQGRTEFAD